MIPAWKVPENHITGLPKPCEWNWVALNIWKPLMALLARSHKSHWPRVWEYRPCTDCWSHNMMCYLTLSLPETATKSARHSCIINHGWVLCKQKCFSEGDYLSDCLTAINILFAYFFLHIFFSFNWKTITKNSFHDLFNGYKIYLLRK